MALALYDEERGYYAGGRNRVGRDGDFFTSVSVGRTFGRIVTERFYRLWEDLDRPVHFLCIEFGANDGAFAEDVLETAQREYPEFYACLDYVIVEPLSRNRSIQGNRLGDRARIVEHMEDVEAGEGVVFGNELFDAFPARMLRVHEGQWEEAYVVPSNDEIPEDARDFSWKGELSYQYEKLDPQPPSHEMPPASSLPEGYVTEWQASYSEFWAKAVNLLTRGLFVFIDYGRTQTSYYEPGRREGTLRTYDKHTRTDNPLACVGERDITVDVNFSALARAALMAGDKNLSLATFTDQAHWLISLAAPLLRRMESRGEALRSPEAYRTFVAQFQTLVHPTHMGMQFHVLEWRKNCFKDTFSLMNPRNNRIHELNDEL